MEKKSYKRKRKTSFLNKAKKYGRKGMYGRGTNLEEDVYQYFVRVLEVHRNGFDSEEDKYNFTKNVLEQTKGEEIPLCCNQLVCRVVETLLPSADDDSLKRFIDVFSADLRKVFVDRFSSHVTQKLLRVASEKASKDEKWAEFVLKAGRFALNNLDEFLNDAYANHVSRTCLETLPLVGGEDVVVEFSERLKSSPGLSETGNSDLSSGFVQTLLKSLKTIGASSKLKSLLTTLLDVCLAPSDPDEEDTKKKGGRMELPKVFERMSSTMLLETCIEVSPAKKLTQIYARIFINRLSLLSLSSNANLSVQKLLRACVEKCDFEAMYDEICPEMEKVAESGNRGVLLALAEGCQCFGTKQGDYINCLMKTYDCFLPEERQSSLVLCLLQGKKFESIEASSEDFSVDLNGSLTVQTLLNFKKPIKVVNSLLSLETGVLLKVLSDPRGCHVSDAFSESEYVGEKSRERLTHKLKGKFADLAISKHGSRSFEALWAKMGAKTRDTIGRELLAKESRLSSTQFGLIVASKLSLSDLRHRPETWATAQNPQSKPSKEKMFSDIIAGLETK